MTTYRLCSEFGWTPEQLREMTPENVEAFITIINAKDEAYEKEVKRRNVRK